MPQVEVSRETDEHIKAIALLLETTPVGVVERLVRQAKDSMAGRLPTVPGSAPSPRSASGVVPGSGSAKGVAVYLTYRHHRAEGTLVPQTGEFTITSPPWNGKAFGSPSGAAGAAILHFNPDRAIFRNGTWQGPASNGWQEWRLASNGEFIQTVRPG